MWYHGTQEESGGRAASKGLGPTLGVISKSQ